MNPSYIATNLGELLDNSPPEVHAIIQSDEINSTTAILGKIYKLPVGSYIALSNIISLILIGALKPEDTVRAIVDILKLSQEDAYRLAEDLEKSILQKVRISVLGNTDGEIKTLIFD